jgi:hypothetical protein
LSFKQEIAFWLSFNAFTVILCLMFPVGLFGTGELDKTKGIVTSASVRSRSFGGGPFGEYGSLRWVPEVRFQYTVAGKKLEGHRLRPAQKAYATESEAMGEVQKFSPGKIVEVYFDSQNPEDAFLISETNVSLGIIAWTGLAIFLLVQMHFGWRCWQRWNDKRGRESSTATNR